MQALTARMRRCRCPPGFLVCVPTYDERDNLERMVEALDSVRELAGASGDVLVIDDSSPGRHGRLADALAERRPWLHVLHRPAQAGARARLPRRLPLGARARLRYVLEMDCDFSHDPAAMPSLLAPARAAPISCWARATARAGASRTGAVRGALISSAGCLYARTLLGVGVRDLTGRLQVLPARRARGDRARRRRCPGLPVPDRDDLPRAAARLHACRRCRSRSPTASPAAPRCRARSCSRRCAACRCCGSRRSAAATPPKRWRRRRPAAARFDRMRRPRNLVIATAAGGAVLRRRARGSRLDVRATPAGRRARRSSGTARLRRRCSCPSRTPASLAACEARVDGEDASRQLRTTGDGLELELDNVADGAHRVQRPGQPQPHLRRQRR